MSAAAPSKTTLVKDIFSPNMFFNIPEYQRPYVWEEDDVNHLLNDVERAFAPGTNREYFLGCMIWNTKLDERNGQTYNYHDILDGQQRFITLFLLQAVLRDLSDSAKLHTTVSQRLWQESNPLDGLPERHRMEFSIREDYDQDFIKKYVIPKSGSLSDAELVECSKNKDLGTSVRHMAQAIITMHSWWRGKRKELADEPEFQTYLFRYFTYLSNHVSVIYLATNDNLDDAYNLFTVLNSRGQKLRPSDILRAQNLRNIDDEKLRKKCASRWEEYQSELEETYHSFDEFLWALVFILIKYRGEVNLSLPKAFENIYKSGRLHPGKNTFDFIGRYVDHLTAITGGNFGGKEAGCLFSNLNFLLTATYGHKYKMLLLYYRECFGEHLLVEFMVKVDNIYSVSWLTGDRNIEQRAFILLRLMEEISKAEPNKGQAAARFLADDALRYDYKDSQSTTALNLNTFFDLLESEEWGSFSGTKINKTRYLLLKLDLLLGSRDAQMTFAKVAASVEHLMPQKIAGTSWDVPVAEHQQWLHRLGNLVLVDSRKNASFGNASFADKKSKYKHNFESRANTNYVFQANSEWSLNALKANHQRVVQILRSYYEGHSFATVIKLWQTIK